MINEYLTSNEQIAYPFSEGAPGLAPVSDPGAVSPTPYLPRDFILDAVACVGPSVGAMYLYSIHRAGTSYTFVFTDGTSTILTSTLTSMPAVHQAVLLLDDVPAPVGTGVYVSFQFVAGPSFATWLATVLNNSTIVFLNRLPLETAVTEIRPDRLLALAASSGSGWQYYTGEIEFVEGYNCGLTRDEGLAPAGRDATPVTIALSPGLGAGLVPCAGSSSTDYLATLMGIAPDEDGNISLITDGCHAVMPMPSYHMVGLDNNCVACCTCDQYAACVEALKKLFDQAASAKMVLDTAAGSLSSDIEAFNGLECMAGKTFVAQLMGAIGTNNYFTIDTKLAMTCNNMPANLVAALRLNGMASAASVTPVSGQVMGIDALGFMAASTIASADLGLLLNAWYIPPPNLLAGPSLEIKATFSVPAGQSATCPSAVVTFSGSGLSVTAKARW